MKSENSLIIEIRGGVLVEVYSNLAEVKVQVVDWDNLNDVNEDIKTLTFPVSRLEAMPTETRSWLETIDLSSDILGK